MSAIGFDKDMIVEEPTYEEKRSRLLDMCEMEGTDMQLHNEIVVELLQYRSGEDPAFGNMVAEIYDTVERTGMDIQKATFFLLNPLARGML